MKKFAAFITAVCMLASTAAFAACDNGTNDGDSTSVSTSDTGSSSTNDSTAGSPAAEEETPASGASEKVDKTTWQSAFSDEAFYNCTVDMVTTLVRTATGSGTDTTQTETSTRTQKTDYTADSNGNATGATCVTYLETDNEGTESGKQTIYVETYYNSETSVYEFYNVYRDEDAGDDNTWKLSSGKCSEQSYGLYSHLGLADYAGYYDEAEYTDDGYVFEIPSGSMTVKLTAIFSDSKLKTFGYSYSNSVTNEGITVTATQTAVATFSDYGATTVTVPDEVKAVYSIRYNTEKVTSADAWAALFAESNFYNSYIYVDIYSNGDDSSFDRENYYLTCAFEQDTNGKLIGADCYHDSSTGSETYQQIKESETTTLYTIGAGGAEVTPTTNADGFSLSDTYFSKLTSIAAFSALSASTVYSNLVYTSDGYIYTLTTTDCVYTITVKVNNGKITSVNIETADYSVNGYISIEYGSKTVNVPTYSTESGEAEEE